MPIVFDEVIGEIEAPHRSEEGQDPAPSPSSVRPEDFDARLELALRLREERLARLCDQ
ncbi:MAG TPA: hypothetical protein PKH69_02940 [Thiobacillaceae bacterium]|nr:hypothetical protein [Thiobacillaceae bacterium]HNU63043.1 hypothetical protein [Thiobacillaceae bacterium]